MRRNPIALSRASSLRKNQTSAESWVWFRLQNRQLLNLKFRRQATIGPYIVDFLCAERKMIIEIDGDSHAFKEKYDRRREAFLSIQGYRVIRLGHRYVHEDLDNAMAHIADLLLDEPSP